MGYKCSQFYIGPFASVDVWDPSVAQAILSTSKHTTKAPLFYDLLRAWLGDGLLIAQGEKWRWRRHLMTPAFHFEILSQFADIMHEQADALVDVLRAKSADGQPIDFFHYITKSALDIIGETAMGCKIGALADGDGANKEYVRAVYDVTVGLLNRLMEPYLLVDWIFYLMPQGRAFVRDLKILHDFSGRVIAERRALRAASPSRADGTAQEPPRSGRAPRQALLDLLLDATDPATGKPMTDQEIKEEVDTFMFEGHDTTAAAIAWAVHLLGKHAAVQERLRNEVDDLYASLAPGERPTMEMLKSRVPYLDCFLAECLRVYPSVPVISRQLTEDLDVDGITIPKGVSTTINIYALNRHPAYWKDPDTFNPERFLPEADKDRHRFIYLPFSAGPRNCIGQKFAHLEEQIIIMQIVRNFEIESMQKDPPTIADVILRPKEGVIVKLTPRVL